MHVLVRCFAFTVALLVGLVTGSSAFAAFPGANGLIAFTSDRTGDSDLWLVDPRTGEQFNFSDSSKRAPAGESAYDDAASWSADGRWLVFAGETDTGQRALFTSKASKSKKRL